MIEAELEMDPLQAEFRDLHGPRLNGFARCLLLGDAAMAELLAADALAAVGMDAVRMHHPERAAAALRAHVVTAARRRRLRPSPSDAGTTVLAHLGIDRSTVATLGRLTLLERAALLAGQVEGFGEDDIAAILGVTPSHARRAVLRARHRYISRHPVRPPALDDPLGPIAERVRQTAARAMGSVNQ